MINDQVSIFNFAGRAQEGMWLDLVTQANAWMVVKWMLAVALVMYAVFALVVIRQVGIMTEAVDGGANGAVKLAAWLHLAGAILVLGMTVAVL